MEAVLGADVVRLCLGENFAPLRFHNFDFGKTENNVSEVATVYVCVNHVCRFVHYSRYTYNFHEHFKGTLVVMLFPDHSQCFSPASTSVLRICLTYGKSRGLGIRVRVRV
jgi:hypothetical protein